jgi:DNA invertase Pin-like site-specific DNA recombinase
MSEPVAYSYIRFSSKRQEAGDSIRRQMEGAKNWAERNNIPLDTSLKIDKGVSAFKGLNADIGALGQFLGLIEKGRVHPGDYLVVEALDRLTRDDVDEALFLLLGMTKAGVKIVQLTPVEIVYSKPVEPLKLMMMVMELMRGNSESRVKSERVSAAWDEKRNARRRGEGQPSRRDNRVNGMEILSHRLPAWIREEGGKPVLIPERAAVVKRIFQLAAAGYGIGAITQKLNKDKVPAMGRGKEWGRPYVTVILRNRAVMGEYQPRKGRGKTSKKDGEVIPDYYPRVITKDEWDAAQAGMQQRKGKPGRPPKRGVNIFAGLVHDAMGGGPLYLIDKGKRGGKVLIPYRAHQGVPGTNRVSFPFGTFESAILRILSEINPDEVTGDGSGSLLNDLEGELKRVKKELAQATEYMDAHGFSPTIAKRITTLEKRQAELEKKLAEADRRTTSSHEIWGEAKDLLAALDKAKDPDHVRMRIRGCLRSVVESIQLLVVPRGRCRLAAVQVWFAGGEKRRDYLIFYRPGWRDRNTSREASWWARSLARTAAPADLDLRRQDHAQRLEKALQVLDLDALDPDEEAE